MNPRPAVYETAALPLSYFGQSGNRTIIDSHIGARQRLRHSDAHQYGLTSKRRDSAIDLGNVHRYDDLIVDLREKLSRMGYSARPSSTPPIVVPSESVDEDFSDASQSEAFDNRSGRPLDIADVLSGRHVRSRDGQCFVAESIFPLDHVHAGSAVSDVLDQVGSSFALLTGDKRLRDLDMRRTILIDTETTGLAGGTGTYAFLIGIGYFADGAFRIDQFFMPDPSHERAMLRAVGEIMSRFNAVISFNGKCFDWPLIETRHVYHRLDLRPSSPMHLDLLFPSRRLFRRRLASRSLGSLERSVLGLPDREGDVPGWLIPQIYFDYLRFTDPLPLVPVFHHNRRDILSMLSLATRLARYVSDPEDDSISDSCDLYSLGRLLDDAGKPAAALVQYQRALAAQPAPTPKSLTRNLADQHSVQRVDIVTSMASAYKRLRDPDSAIELWESLIALGPENADPYVELAKHREHRQRDFLSAARLTEEAIARHISSRAFLPPGRYAQEQMALRHRLFRLNQKLARASMIPEA